MVTDEGIFEAYYDCVRRKAGTFGAVEYLQGMEEDLIALADEINSRNYQPTTSTTFVVTKPRPREVFAACFRDRVVHHYIMIRLEPIFEEMFSPRTFNCRKGKGVLYGVKQLTQDIRACSANYTQSCYAMKLDLQGFFMSIDKDLLDGMLRKFIVSNYKGDDIDDILYLSHVIIMHRPETDCTRKTPSKMWNLLPKNKSLFTSDGKHGLPIGNLSSQHFANFLLHELDMFIEKLGFQYHGRYVDDFYIVHNDKQKMLNAVPLIRKFLKDELHITLHPHKFYIQHYSKGIQFTGSVVKFDRIYPSKRTVRHLKYAIRNLNNQHSIGGIEKSLQSVNSLLGIMRHHNAYHIRRKTLMNIQPHIWEFIYIKGRFHSVSLRKTTRI